MEQTIKGLMELLFPRTVKCFMAAHGEPMAVPEGSTNGI